MVWCCFRKWTIGKHETSKSDLCVKPKVSCKGGEYKYVHRNNVLVKLLKSKKETKKINEKKKDAVMGEGPHNPCCKK